MPVKPETFRPPPLDIAIAAVFVAMTVAEGLLNPHVESFARHLGIAGVAMASLAWRRRAPLVVAGIVVAANLLINPQGEFSTLLSLVLVCFTVGSETKPPRTYLGLGIVLVPFLVVAVVEQFEPSDLAAALVFFVGPWAVGILVSNRTASAQAAVARAAQLERQAELEAASARAEERTRIARELHDIVSHSISVVTIQTQAVRRRLGPDHAREAADLAAVEATAREALAEMRRLFGVLRADGESPGLAPQPGLAELDRLVRQVGAGEMTVRLEVEGDPVPLSPGLDLAAYRIAQEGLTNAVRHASGHRGAGAGAVLTAPARRRGRRQRARPGGRAARRARTGRHPRAGGAVRRHRDPRAVGGRRGPPGRQPAARRPGGGGPMTAPVRVLIVDDQGMVRAGFRSLLGDEPDIEVVGEAANGEEAVALAGALAPDVTLMDIRMPVLDGIAATRRLVEAGVATRVLVLTTFALDEYVFEALRAGASGFLLKDAPAEELVAAIRVVAAGDALLAPAVTRGVIDAFVHRGGAVLPTRDPSLELLTPRELEVLGLLARGLSNLDIATTLYVSEGTTKTHVSNVLAKLGLRDRVQAVVFAYENGVVVPGDPG